MNEAQNFLFENHGIRGGIVRIHETWLQTIAEHHYPEAIRNILGETVASTVLLAASLKRQPRLSLQLQTEGRLRLLIVQCSGDLHVRAMAQHKTVKTAHGLLAKGRLSVQIDTGEENGFFQGIVPLEGPRIANSIESYFEQSEQLNTRLFLFSDEQHVSGLMLQMLPGTEDHDCFSEICILADTLTQNELTNLSGAQLLQRLFAGYEIRLFDARPVLHDCRCTPTHLASIARMLGAKELNSLIAERGNVELTCEFCNRSFRYSDKDVGKILRGETPAASFH